MKHFTLLFLFLSTAFLVNAQNCASGWAYYRTVTIDNTAGDALTDYQVRLLLNTAELATEGKLRADGADLRIFSDDCTLLPFWGDSLGTSTQTSIWVKIPSLAAGATMSLQVYYGKSDAASAADGDGTFLFFDDFTSGVVSPAKWETVGEFAQLEIEDGILAYASTGEVQGPRFKFARTVPVFSEEVIFDYVGAVTNANGFGFSSNAVTLDRLLFRQGSNGFDTLDQVAIMRDTFDNGFQSVGDFPFLRFPRFDYNTASIRVGVHDNAHIQVTRFANEGLGTANLDTLLVTQLDTLTGFHFIMSTFSNFQTIYMDNIRVRKVTATPPTTTAGMEMMLDPNGVNTLIDPSLVNIFPNPASQYITVDVMFEEQARAELNDVNGRSIPLAANLIQPGERKTIALPQLPSGIYFLSLRRNNDNALLHTQKIKIVQ